MKKIVLLLCLLLLPALAWAAPTWRITWLDMDETARPTGAFCYEDALYTSNQGSGASKGDGFILRYNLEDRVETKLLNGKLYDPKGFVIVRNRLLLIDQNLNGEGKPGLILADLKQDKVIAVTSIAEFGELHGITALNSSNFIVTDKANEQLFMVKVGDSDFKIENLVINIGEASGVTLHDSFIYVAGSALDEKTQQIKSGCIYQIDPFTTVTQRFVTLTQTTMGYLNALTGHRGYLFAGDWTGQSEQETAEVYVINTSSKRRVAKIDVAPGATDIAAWSNALYLPYPDQNKVMCIDVDFESLGR